MQMLVMKGDWGKLATSDGTKRWVRIVAMSAAPINGRRLFWYDSNVEWLVQPSSRGNS